MVIYIDNHRYRGDIMYQRSAELFKVLSDENRLKIIELLIKGETCGCTLIDNLPISQPTLSYHLKMLSKYGITKSEKIGNRTNHYVNKEVLTELSELLKTLANLKDDSCTI